jgi:hypothetical protein
MNRSELRGDQIFDNEADGVKVSEIETRPGNGGDVPSRSLVSSFSSRVDPLTR